MAGITVNGKSLEQFLKVGRLTDIELERQQEIKERTITKRQGLGRIDQQYNEKPSRPRIWSKGDISKLNAQSNLERIQSEMEEEAKIESPSLKKLFAAVLLLSDWLTTSEINKKINSMIKERKPFDDNTTSSLISNVTSNRLRIGNLIEKRKVGNKNFYRLFPSCVQLHLSEFRDLFSKYPNITTEELFARIPSLKEEILSGDPIVKLKEPTTSTKPKKIITETPTEIIVDTVETEIEEAFPDKKLHQKTASIFDQHLKTEPGSEIKINVNVEFGVIRVLFGIDH